jgi:hypothetical protein
MVDEFKKLKADFEATRARFRNAKTLEEKRAVLAISQEIIRETQDKIVEFKALVSAVRASRDVR